MKIPKLKFSLPKISTPKISLPKLALPKFGKKKKAEEELDSESEDFSTPVAEDAETDGAPRARKGFLPKLRGKARVIVPLAAVLVLAAAGGGGFYLWRMMKAPTEAAASGGESPKGGTESALAQKAEAEGPKPEVSAPHALEKSESKKADGGQGQDSGSQASESLEAKAPEGGGHEGGGGGKDKVAVTPLPLPPPPSEIETMVRRLQDLQERISVGDGVAFQEMPKHLRALGRKIFDAPPQTWEKKENAHALIVYLLSGGNAAAGRKALAAPKFHGGDAPLAKAAVAYLENVEGPDRDYMLRLDPLNLDPTLGASVAFVQSILLTPGDRDFAVAKLDVARLLAPGGLVEEAALRREIGLLAEEKQYQRFASLGRQYWARFRASPYADNFLRQFMLGVARVALSIKLEEWRQLNDFVESLTPETKRNIYLTVAQNASVVGNVDLALMAAQRARDLSVENSQERQRAIVYGALAAVGAADAATSAHLLEGVERAQLPAGDQPLYDAAAYVSGRIFRAPAKGFKEPPPGGANAADADMARAEKLLTQGDAVIESVRKTMARKNP